MEAELTWTCHVCHETRPDRRISVLSKPGAFHGLRYQQNIRFCNDRQACIDGAKNVDFLLNPMVDEP